jgi:putative acetyltransferase
MAFGQPDEGRIVDAVRGTDHWIAALSLVAEAPGGGIVGHSLTSLADLVADGGRRRRVLALGPVGVLPDRQRLGIGTALVAAGIDEARRAGWPLIVVLGHASYYSRFGFEPARPFGVEPPRDWPDAHWMALRLSGWTPEHRGVVRYPPAFGID